MIHIFKNIYTLPNYSTTNTSFYTVHVFKLPMYNEDNVSTYLKNRTNDLVEYYEYSRPNWHDDIYYNLSSSSAQQISNSTYKDAYDLLSVLLEPGQDIQELKLEEYNGNHGITIVIMNNDVEDENGDKLSYTTTVNSSNIGENILCNSNFTCGNICVPSDVYINNDDMRFRILIYSTDYVNDPSGNYTSIRHTEIKWNSSFSHTQHRTTHTEPEQNRTHTEPEPEPDTHTHTPEHTNT